MGRLTWDLIKSSKGFYISTYRKGLTALLFSAFLNVILGVSVYYYYINLPQPDYYATNGVSSPIELTAFDSPNYSSTPLLANDPTAIDNERIIPK